LILSTHAPFSTGWRRRRGASGRARRSKPTVAATGTGRRSVSPNRAWR